MKFSFLKSKIVHNISKLAFGNIIGELIGILSIPVITRIYSPSEIGIFMFFFSVSDILANFVIGKYDSAIVISNNKKEAINIIQASFILTFINSMLLGLVFIIFGNYFMNFLGLDNLTLNNLIIIPFLIISLNLYKIADHWNNYNRNYLIMARAKVLQKAIAAILQIIFSFFGFLGLVFGRFISQIISSIYMFIIGNKSLKINGFKSINYRKNLMILKKYSDFPKFYLPSTISNRISYNLPNITFSKLFTTEINGLYSLSYRLIASPMGIIMSSIGQIFYKEASLIYSSNKKNLYPFLKSFYKNIFIIGIIPFTILFFIAPDLFAFLLGKEWLQSGKFIQILIPWLFLVFLNSPLTSVLIILKKQKQLFIYEFLSMFSRVFIVIFSAFYYDDPIYTVGAYSSIGFLCSFCLFVYIIKSTKNC
tara:strand:- start:3126 stop:4391 length:1266 start_codon:yes stop_codon:yes gene_type:complete